MKISINKRKARVLALICFIGFQPMPVKAATNVNEWMNCVAAYLAENKQLAAVSALFGILFAGFVGRKMYVKQNVDKLESLLGFDRITSTMFGSTGVHGSELYMRNEKLTRILYFIQDKQSDSMNQNQLPEALNLLTISGAKHELMARQENALIQELDRSNIWQMNTYAYCGQALMGQGQYGFKESHVIGEEYDISQKKEIRNRLTSSQRQYAGLKAFVGDFGFKNNNKAATWLENTAQFKDSLRQILS